MNSSFLYHAWGLYHHKCLREEYKGNRIILHIESKRVPKYCPQCGHPHLVKNGFRTRDFISLPIVSKKVILRIKVHRYKCKCPDCDNDCRERIAFVLDSHSYTRRFARYVVDLKSCRILYVGQGKAADALAGFWKRIRRKKIDIRYIATDLSAAFISSVHENCPNAVHVFDHFHVVKLMNEKLDDIRWLQYNMEKDVNKRKVLKGTHYLLLCNRADIFDKEYRTRLDNALNMNKPLSQAYYLKEQLREIWTQPDKQAAEKVMLDWIEQARESKVPQLMKTAGTIMAYRSGIPAWYNCPISTGKVEGISNKIKVMKITPNVG